MNERPLGGPVLRVLQWGWRALVLAATIGWATGRFEAALPLTGLVAAIAAALLATPALVFLGYALRHPAADVPRAMRRAAVENGASLLVVGAVLVVTVRGLDLSAVFVAPVAAMALLGVAELVRGVTLDPVHPLPAAASQPSLRHRGATISGAVTLLLFAVLAPRVLGGGPQPGAPTEANMRVDLRSLVTHQDDFFASHGRYASLSELGTVFRPSFSHADIVVAAESTRFIARATSPGTRLVCLVWTGTPVPPADSVHGAVDGVPACWRP